MSHADIEIGSAAKPARKGRTIPAPKPRAAASSPSTHPAVPAQRPTTRLPKPRSGASGVAKIEIGLAAKPARKGRTMHAAKPSRAPSSPSTFGAGANWRSKSNGQSPRSPIESTRLVVTKLVQNQRYRRFAIKGQQFCDRRIEALIAGELHYDAFDEDETKRKAIFKQAAAIRVHVEKAAVAATTDQKPIGTDIVPPELLGSSRLTQANLVKAILTGAESRATWDGMRTEHEVLLEQSARDLPVYAWAKAINGFGDRGLAIIVAEAAGTDPAGPDGEFGQRRTIAEYRTVSGLWKRMGLAVIDGERQKRTTGKRGSPEERQKYAYVAERRAECWVLGDSLLRAQLCSEVRACKEAIKASPDATKACAERGIEVRTAKKAETLRPIIDEFGLSAEPHPTGPYGEVYTRRRTHTAPRIAATKDLPAKVGGYSNPLKWTPGRCHNDAARIMFKELLKDLWIEWRRVDREAVAAD